MPITDALKRVYASAPTDTQYVETLQLYHSLFPTAGSGGYFLNNDFQEWLFRLEDGSPVTFGPIPFAVVLPQQDARGQQDLQITIDNIGREIMAPIEAAATMPSEPITVIYRVYLNQPTTYPQNDPPLELRLSNIAIGLQAVTGTATRADTLNRSFPSVLYRADTYPGLDR